MYEQFGGLVDQQTKTVTFTLFVPDGERVPSQYEGGGLPRVKDVFVVGSFQDPVTRQWNVGTPIPMKRRDYFNPVGGATSGAASPSAIATSVLKGFVYEHTTKPLPDGFYEYKYLIHFENAAPRFITDPCGRYGGTQDQNSGFVVGGQTTTVKPLQNRLPLQDLIIYELMIDDFTVNIRKPNEAPLQTVIRKLDDLVKLGVNAIEFMPWMAWIYPDDPAREFSWGYNPVQYFSVAHKYTNNPATETDKLVYLKQLINACHDRGLHVIMDGVFNHADAAPPDRGFPYYWLYQDTADSPYVGNFAQAAFFQDLDYDNRCTLEYIRDACFYWIDTFQIDGIRLDNTLGFYRSGDRGHGLPKLLSELRGHLSQTGNKNFAIILEHSWDYAAIDVVNKVGATSCWIDPYRSQSMSYLGDRPQGKPQIEPPFMRMLDAGRDFSAGRVPTCYIENHDHRRFMLKAGGRDFWYLTQPYVIALLTSAGAPLIYNGQEFGQDNDMPEDGDKRVVPRPIDWNLLTSGPGPQITAFYQRLMKLRHDHPGLHSSEFHPRGWHDDWRLLDEHGFGLDRERNVVVYHRWGDDGQGHLERFYIVLNFSAESQNVAFEVPDGGPWQELLGGGSVTPTHSWLKVDVGSNWGAIYYQKY